MPLKNCLMHKCCDKRIVHQILLQASDIEDKMQKLFHNMGYYLRNRIVKLINRH